MECVSTTRTTCSFENKQTTKRKSRKRGITAVLHDASNLGIGEVVDNRECMYKAAESMQQFNKNARLEENLVFVLLLEL